MREQTGRKEEGRKSKNGKGKLLCAQLLKSNWVSMASWRLLFRVGGWALDSAPVGPIT